MQFDADMSPAHLQGEVQASMKKRVYKVEIYIDLAEGISSSTCTCPRGQVICHHMAALLYYAHYNISATDKAREWGPKEAKNTDIALSIDELYPQKPYSELAENAIIKVDEFREMLGTTNMVGFSWLLKPEASTTITTLAPSIDEILFSKEYFCAEDKNIFLLEKCRLTVQTIKEIAESTVGQDKNEGWLILRKMRLTASKFGSVISAVRLNKFHPSSRGSVKL